MPSAGPDDPLPDGWEMSWTELVGSPRFEEARQACGCRLEDLQPQGSPSKKGLDSEVMKELEERREKRRLYELRTVMVERERLVDKSKAAAQGDSTDWAAKMKAENQARIQQLKEAAIRANEVQQRRTCFELAKSLAIETRAQQMADGQRQAEIRAKERQARIEAELRKQALERKEKRIQMEIHKQNVLQAQEEEMVKKLYDFKQKEQAIEAMVR